MELSNFRMVSKHNTKLWELVFIAKVDVTTGILWWKKTETHLIGRRFTSSWVFLDNPLTPMPFMIYALETAYFIRQGTTIDKWEPNES